jgi:hypothetical protein
MPTAFKASELGSSCEPLQLGSLACYAGCTVRSANLVVVWLVAACGGQDLSGRATPGVLAEGGTGALDGGASPGPFAERSGTRLQAVYWFSGEIPVARKELRDGEKDVPCEMARAEDGVFRCLPVSQGGKVYFLDDRCTGP